MARRKNWSAEQIIATLRQIEVQMAQGKSIALACKEAEISEQSYFRWRKEYGGVAVEQAKRLKDLERENTRLRRLVADLSLEKQILKDVASGNPARSGAGRRSLASGKSTVSQSAMPAGSSASRAGRSGTFPPSELTRMHSPDPSWPLPPSTAATATGGSPPCCRSRAGAWAGIGCSASGAARGSRSRRSTNPEAGCGSTTAPASGCGPSEPITCGASTSSRVAPMMDGASGL
jgi:putative transposase